VRKTKVAIVILNWNGWEDTIECLESVYQITYPNYDVIVVDNGSEDESIEKIKDYVEGKIKVESRFFEYSNENKPIKIIEYTREEAEAGGGKEGEIANLPSNRRMIIIKNEKNYGFAEGNNIGVRYALKALNPDYVLLLNNDTAVDKEFLGELVKIAESDEKIGIGGPKIYYYDNPIRIWLAGGKLSWYPWSLKRRHNIIDKGQFETISDVDFIPGTCMLIKKEVIVKIGLLPTEYFLQWEDIDYCIHARSKNFRCIYVPDSKIWHKVSASYHRSKLNYFQTEMGIRNRILFWHKYLSNLQFLFYCLIFIFISSPMYLIYYIICHRDLKRVQAYIKGAKKGFIEIFGDNDYNITVN